MLDNVVAPEYDRQRVERQRKMEDRHKFYMVIGPAVVMSIQMFVMGVALIVLPFCYPNGILVSNSSLYVFLKLTEYSFRVAIARVPFRREHPEPLLVGKC